jgi:uncharacterized protein (TIGR02677 family)
VALYRGIMQAFSAAKARFALHLRVADIAGALADELAGPAPGEIEAALAQLCIWGNLEAHPDNAEVATVEEFLRPRHLYRATAAAEAAESALAFFFEALKTPGELQTTALADIRESLGELAQLAAAEIPDAGKVHRAFSALRGRFDELTSRAQTFMSSLQRAIDLHGVEVDTFQAYKALLIEYLERFIGDLIIATSDIATKLACIEASGVERLLELTADRDLVDALHPTADDQEAARRLWRIRWQGLAAWFVRTRGEPSQAEVLRTSAVGAIAALLTAATEINDRRFSRSDRTADLRTLARWFAQAENEPQAHQLWRAAFALSPARHLQVDRDTLDDRQDSPLSAQASWLDAPPLQISPRLRTRGHHAARGPAKSIIDRSREKALLAADAQQEAAQLAAARQHLLAIGAVRLSEIGPLDKLQFAWFLDLLGEALARKVLPTDEVQATSSDGTLAVRLAPTGDDRQAVIEAEEGTFSGPDHWITICEAFADDARTAPSNLAAAAAPQGQPELAETPCT